MVLPFLGGFFGGLLAQPGPRSFVLGALAGAWGAQAYPTGVPDLRREALRLWATFHEWERRHRRT